MRDWEWVVGVNLWGVVHGLQVFLPHLEGNADGGHVVNTASMAGLAPFPGIGVYNATKYAVVGISETLAIELAGSGVGVSVLCPGVVNTNIFRSQRNRPEHLRNPQRNAAARAANDELVGQEGIDPSVVADKVANAIREGEFWIITHPDLLTHVDARHRALMRHALDH
jgi:NAD(P)-dependent dehydrogenase (short-subunit alcohol dehydrogenase family)